MGGTLRRQEDQTHVSTQGVPSQLVVTEACWLFQQRPQVKRNRKYSDKLINNMVPSKTLF